MQRSPHWDEVFQYTLLSDSSCIPNSYRKCKDTSASPLLSWLPCTPENLIIDAHSVSVWEPSCFKELQTPLHLLQTLLLLWRPEWLLAKLSSVSWPNPLEMGQFPSQMFDHGGVADVPKTAWQTVSFCWQVGLIFGNVTLEFSYSWENERQISMSKKLQTSNLGQSSLIFPSEIQKAKDFSGMRKKNPTVRKIFSNQITTIQKVLLRSEALA